MNHSDYLSTAEGGAASTIKEVTFADDFLILTSNLDNLLFFFEGSYMLSSSAGLMRYRRWILKPLCLRTALLF